MKRPYTVTALAAFALAGVIASAHATTVYRWTDERGVVNYSNDRPKGRAPKDLHVIEDRVSVYTPEKLPERVRYVVSNPGMAAPDWRAPAASPVPLAYDYCAATPNDPNCYPMGVYGAPVFRGRGSPFAQPQLPPGAIAGNVTGPGAYIPGLSANAPTPTPLARGFRSAEPSASFTLPPRGHGSRR